MSRSSVDTYQRRQLDRPRTTSKFAGLCRGCNEHYQVGTTVTPVKGLGGSTLWAHWQPDLSCAKAADSFISHSMTSMAKNQQAR